VGRVAAEARRSALFLSVTAEEGGLRGSEYYAAHPLYPAGKTAVDLNYDALYPFGRAKDVVLTGASDHGLALAQQIAKRLSSRFLPMRSPSRATTSAPTTSHSRTRECRRFPSGTHRVSRQAGGLRPEDVGRVQQPALPPALGRIPGGLGFTAVQQAAEYGFALGLEIANQDKLPDWRPRDQFHR